MPQLNRRRPNPVTTRTLTPDELEEFLAKQREEERKKGRGEGYHQTKYSVPRNNKGRLYR